MDVQRLRLVDVHSSVCCHVQYNSLLDFPHCLVQIFQILWKSQHLHASVVCNELHAQLLRPESARNKISEKMLVHLHELAGQHPSNIKILRVRLERLVVPENLGCARRRHGRNQERISKSMVSDFLFQTCPVPSTTLRGSLPQVELQLSLTCGRARIGLVGAQRCGQFARGLTRRKIDGLEYVFVQATGALTLERHPQHHEGISQPLHSETNRPVLHVGTTSLLHGIEISLNDLVQIPGRHLRDSAEFLKIVGAVLDTDKCRKGYGG
mmetsp:Transcript_18779/g.50399  ORF Transcript_18779/g.50399 Transcript_18779/m.50399 type:complete len:267 (-) Transcript_18779:808-1608(-)